MTLEEFREHCFILCGKAEEIVLRLHRLSKGNYHCDFGDAICIYRDSLELRDQLNEIYKAVDKVLSERENEGSAK